MDAYWLDAEHSIRYREEIENTAVNAQRIQAYLQQSDDFITSSLHFGAVTAHLFCIDGLVKDSVVDENILSAFHELDAFKTCKSEKEAVKLIDHKAVVEASGGIDETTLADAAKSGVDVISVGALTHSVKALDISMDIGEIK